MIRSLTRKMLGSAAAAVDRVATAAVSAHAARGQAQAPPHADRRRSLERLAALAGARKLDDFFSAPARLEPNFRLVRELGSGLSVSDLSWSSDYTPADPEISERYLSGRENAAAVARGFLRAVSPRPVAILIHGYLAGAFALEERIWPLPLFDRLGYDVLLFTLPFHGLRARAGRGPVPEFPGGDPRVNLEGFRQALFDLRSLVAWLRARGHPRVGVVGMSLGGYTAALLATVEPALDFVVPVIPLSSLADFAREQGSLSALPEEAAREHELLEIIYGCVSPTARPSLVAPARALVIAAKADRITPAAHARRLAVHLRAPLRSFYGGHLLQLGRSEAFSHIEALLSDSSSSSR